MANQKLSPLSYALLGLLKGNPSTGYAVRMVFETTPMASFSSSPGSIYPALQKLEKLGLVRKDPPGSRTLALTTKGEDALERWFHQPVTLEEVSSDLGTTLLRFAFLQGHSDRKLTRAFLDSFESAARAHAADLKTFLKSETAASLSTHARAAVEHGLMSIKTSADWAAETRRRFKTAAKKEKGK